MIPNSPLFRKVHEMAASPISRTKLTSLEPYLVPAIVLVVGLGAFGLGRLSAGSGQPTALRVLYPDAVAAEPLANTAAVANRAGASSAKAPQGTGAYVASKNGTKYYLVSCSSANRIKEENKVYFGSAQEAAAAGYEPAANCPGL